MSPRTTYLASNFQTMTLIKQKKLKFVMGSYLHEKMVDQKIEKGEANYGEMALSHTTTQNKMLIEICALAINQQTSYKASQG